MRARRAVMVAAIVVAACSPSTRSAVPTTVVAYAEPHPICDDGSAHAASVVERVTRVRAIESWTPEACAETTLELERLASERCASDAGVVEACLAIAWAHERCGDPAAALDAYGRVLERRPSHCVAGVAIAGDLVRDGRGDQARVLLQRVARDEPRCASAWTALAAIERDDPSSPRAAIESAQRAIAVGEGHAAGYVELALAHLALGEIELAEDAIVRAIAAGPSLARAHVARGLIAERRGDVHAAISAYDRAIEIDPDAIDARMNRGGLHLAVRAHDLAAPDYQRAVELEPERYEAWLGLGIALRGLGRTEEARAAYERAIEIDRDRPEAYYDLGVLLDDPGLGELAARRATLAFRDFVRLAENRPDLGDRVGEVSAQCGCDDVPRRARDREAWCRRAPRVAADGCVRGRIERIECAISLHRDLVCMQLEARRMTEDLRRSGTAEAASESME